MRKMKRICNDSSNCILYFLQALIRIFRKTLERLLQKSIDLFDIIYESTSLIQDSIVEKADEANSGEND